MTVPNLLFYLRPDLSNYYYIRTDGVMDITGTPAPVPAPDGWDKTILTHARDRAQHGVFGIVSTNYKFVKDAAQILRTLDFGGYGSEAVCILQIDIRNDDDKEYTLMALGAIDFGVETDGRDSYAVTTLKGGLSALLDANGTTPYELLVDPTDALSIYNDGVTLQATQNFVPLPNIYNYSGTAVASLQEAYIVPLIPTNRDGDFPIGDARNPEIIVFDASGFPTGSPFVDTQGVLYPNYNFAAAVAQANTFKDYELLKIVNTGANTSFSLELWVVDNTTTITAKYVIDSFSVTAGLTTAHTINNTTTGFNLAVKDRLYYILSISNSTASLGTIEFTGNTTAVVYQSQLYSTFRYLPSTTLGYRYYQVMQKLFDALSAGVYTCTSNYLTDPTVLDVDTVPFNWIELPGDAIRGLSGATIKTTITDYLTDVFNRGGCGFGIGADGNGFIEKLALFYDSTTLIADLGEVINFTCENDPDSLFNNIKVGYEVKDTDNGNLNGKDDTNTTQTDKYPIVAKKWKDYDGTCPNGSSIYLIEKLRINLSEKTTTDDSTDNDNFCITIGSTARGDGSFPLYRPDIAGGATVIGVFSPDTVYNVDVSPRHNFTRNVPFIASTNFFQQGKTITFQTTDKNAELQSDFNLGSGVIIEKADVPVNGIKTAALWMPKLFKFSTAKFYNVAQLITATPYGYFSFTWKGASFKGFLITSSINTVSGEAQDWTLLACADNNLLPLQHG